MSFPTYETYKDSGVEWLGQVPAHWDVVRLKNVLQQRVTDGPHTTPIFIDDGIPFLSVDGIQDGELVFEGCRYVSMEDHIAYRVKAAPRRGDLLLGKAASTGKIARVKVDFEFSIWSPLALIRVEPLSARPAFVEYALKSPIAQAQIDNYCTSNTQKNISMDDIPRLSLLRPPVGEQIDIVHFLDHETAKIDALVEEQQRLIELLKEKRQAVISHAVTKGLNPNTPMKESEVEWLGKVPAHWTLKPIKRVLASIEQGWSPQCEGYPAEVGQWGVLKVGCVNGGSFHAEENKTLPLSIEPVPSLAVLADDLLVSRANTRDLVGSAAVVPQDHPNLLLCDKLYRLRFPRRVCTPRYVSLFLSTPAAREQIELAATGASSSMVNIGQSTILEIVLALPDVSEQEAIVGFIDSECAKLDELTKDVEHAIGLLSERRTALISAAVTGKIDVRSKVPHPEPAPA